MFHKTSGNINVKHDIPKSPHTFNYRVLTSVPFINVTTVLLYFYYYMYANGMVKSGKQGHIFSFTI